MKLTIECDSVGAERLMAVNDEENIDEQTREAWITEGFRVVLGVDVEFVDGDP